MTKPRSRARRRGMVHRGRCRRAGAARQPVHDVRHGVLPGRVVRCRNPACDGSEFEPVPAVAARHGVVVHRRAVPAAAAVRPDHRSVRAVRHRRGRAGRREDGRARPGRRRLRRRRPARRQRGRARRRDALRGRRQRVPIWRWKPAKGPDDERRRTRHRRPRRRHAPVGQVGPQLRRVRRRRRARRARRRRRRLARRAVRRRRRHHAQRLPRLRRRARRSPRRSAGSGAAGGVVLRRVRLGRDGARRRPGPDPRRAVRRRARRRRRHHAEGLPRAERRRPPRRPGLAAVPPARRHQPDVLRALRPPPHGPLRRDRARLRQGEGEERAPRPAQPERALPQGGRPRTRCSPSPMVADPLRLLDICATSDGGAAVVLSSMEFARRHGATDPVRVRGDLHGHADVPEHGHRDAELRHRLGRRARAARR